MSQLENTGSDESFDKEKIAEDFIPIIRRIARRVEIRWGSPLDLTELVGAGTVRFAELLAQGDHQRVDDFNRYARKAIRNAMWSEVNRRYGRKSGIKEDAQDYYHAARLESRAMRNADSLEGLTADDSSESTPHDPVSRAPSPEDKVYASELRALVMSDVLNDNERAVIMTLADGEELKDLESSLDVSRDKIQHLKYRARTKLHRALARGRFEEELNPAPSDGKPAAPSSSDDPAASSENVLDSLNTPALHALVMSDLLTDGERAVIMGLANGGKNSELASKLGLHQTRISHLKRSAVNKLQKALKKKAA